MDELLHKLKVSGVGCYMGCELAGCVCYADDLALLAPSPAALRIMLHIWEDFAKFGKGSSGETFMFCGTQLEFSQEVIHLGHTLGKS